MQSQRNSILEYQIYVVNILGPKLSIQTFTFYIYILGPKVVHPNFYCQHFLAKILQPKSFTVNILGPYSRAKNVPVNILPTKLWTPNFEVVFRDANPSKKI